ncbi:MAG: hypothetical protein AAF620_15260 [Bacteroidota bacterium]
MTIAKQLNKEFGGKWEYLPGLHWWVCEELDARAMYVAGGYNELGDYVPVSKEFRRLALYGLKGGVKYLYPRGNQALLRSKLLPNK